MTKPVQVGPNDYVVANEPPTNGASMAPPTAPEFPAHLYEVPGLLGELCDYLNATAFKQQPLLTLANSIALINALIGRHYSIAGIKGNIQIIAVAGTGCGKDNARSEIKTLLYEAGLEHYLIEDLASDAGLLSALREHESRLYQQDEIGKFLQTTKGEKHYLANIITELMKLYTSAKGVYQGKRYSQQNKKDEDDSSQQSIEYPNLVLFGTTTPRRFFNNLSFDELEDGFLSRNMVVFGDETPPLNEQHPAFNGEPLPDNARLINRLKTACDLPNVYDPQGDLDESINFSPAPVRFTRAAQSLNTAKIKEYLLRHDALKAQQDPASAIWSRVHGFAIQCALAHTIPQYFNAEIDIDALDWGFQLSEHCAERFIFEAKAHLAENEQQKNTNKIINLIRKAGTEGISMSDLGEHLRSIKRLDRLNILDDLEQDGVISHQELPPKGKGKRKTFMYFMAGE